MVSIAVRPHLFNHHIRAGIILHRQGVAVEIGPAGIAARDIIIRIVYRTILGNIEGILCSIQLESLRRYRLLQIISLLCCNGMAVRYIAHDLDNTILSTLARCELGYLCMILIEQLELRAIQLVVHLSRFVLHQRDTVNRTGASAGRIARLRIDDIVMHTLHRRDIADLLRQPTRWEQYAGIIFDYNLRLVRNAEDQFIGLVGIVPADSFSGIRCYCGVINA